MLPVGNIPEKKFGPKYPKRSAQNPARQFFRNKQSSFDDDVYKIKKRI